MSSIRSAEWFKKQAQANRRAIAKWPRWLRETPLYGAATFPQRAAQAQGEKGKA